jgi:hypothetical protein
MLPEDCLEVVGCWMLMMTDAFSTCSVETLGSFHPCTSVKLVLIFFPILQKKLSNEMK